MEDFLIYEPSFTSYASLFGIIDGHNGPQIAKFTQKNFSFQLKKHSQLDKQPHMALFSTIQKMDDLLIQDRALQINNNCQEDSGCTAIFALIIDKMIYIGKLLN